MFVRFREKICDGFAPEGVTAKIPCAGRCHRGARGCPIRPRCRWRIGADEGLYLVPRRLYVGLAENTRVDGKVRQEHVAHLGAIDGWLLPAFWADLDPAMVARVRRPDWELRSLRARLAFWQEAGPRLKRLENRLGPELKRLRMAIHARVPWPMEPERKRLELLEAEAGLVARLVRADGQNDRAERAYAGEDEEIAPRPAPQCSQGGRSRRPSSGCC